MEAGIEAKNAAFRRENASSASIEQSLISAAKSAISAAQRSAQSQLLRAEVLLPAFDPWASWAWDFEPSFAWSSPAEGGTYLAFGALEQASAEGPERFDRLSQHCSRIFERTFVAGPAAARSPLAFSGGSFADHAPKGIWAGWAAAALTVPRLWLWRDSTGAGVSVTVSVAADSDPRVVARSVNNDLHQLYGLAERPFAQEALARETIGRSARDLIEREPWMNGVRRATGAIAESRLNKVVLARPRRFELAAGASFDLQATLLRLRKNDPSAFIFAVRGPNGGWFAGASPELLARVDGTRVEAVALAGTRPRGKNEAHDRELAEELYGSTKERLEHVIVARAIEAALRPALSSIDPLPAPRVVRFGQVQHLYTPISGLLAPGGTLLSIASRLHPTPAVGGAPRRAALEWIAEHEGFDRGWYAGPIGFLGPNGGVLCVGLRSALIGDSSAVAFAGAGIVAGSIAEREWDETEIKLGAISRGLAERGPE